MGLRLIDIYVVHCWAQEINVQSNVDKSIFHMDLSRYM